MARLAALLAALLCAACGGRLQQVPERPAAVSTPEFAREMERVAMNPWTAGNAVRTLENGDAYFPAILAAVRKAERSITFECFAARECPTTAEFSRVFADKARAGVKVHLILDGFGCTPWGRHHIAAMREAGVDVRFYHPWHPLRQLRYNYRTHRRIVVVDGRTAFVGGAGWAYNWTGNAQDPKHWRDTEYEIRGPAVAQVQAAFNDNWAELAREPLAGPDYFPPLRREGPLLVQSVTGSPEKQPDTIGSTALLALRAAKKSIAIEHSYFLPTDEITAALLAAAARKVRVEILLPGHHTDMPFAKEITRRTLARFLDAGISIYEYQPTMMHGKLILVDDLLTIAGSGNLDPRSFFINDENNIHILDAAFARTQRAMFERDKRRSLPLTHDGLRLGWFRTLRGVLGKPFEGQL